MVTVSYTALTTPDEVQRNALKSERWVNDIHTNPDVQEALRDVIEDETDRIRSYLNRNPIVRRYKGTSVRWCRQIDGTYLAHTHQWPAVQTDSGSITITDDGELEALSPVAGFVYYAGWRRSDQELAHLQKDLPELEVLPPLLPGAIRRAAIQLVIVEMRRQIHGLVGMSSHTQTIGGDTVSVQRENTAIVNQILSSIRAYRRIPI